MIKNKKAEDIEQVEPAVDFEEPEKPVYRKKSVDVDSYIARKLKVINEWPDGAKKRNAADRILKNKEV